MLPTAIARQQLMHAAETASLTGLRRLMRCTEDRQLIEDASRMLTRKLFAMCVENNLNEMSAEGTSMISFMQRCFIALDEAQFDGSPVLTLPPWEALQMHAECAHLMSRDNAVTLLFRGMKCWNIDFNTTNAGRSLIMHAIEVCGCGEASVSRLLSTGLKFSDDEMASGDAIACIVRRVPGVISQLCGDVRFKKYANTRVQSLRDGGTVLHLVCREVQSDELVECYVHLLVSVMGVDPAVLNDNLMAAHQLLMAERPNVGDHRSMALQRCVRFLISVNGRRLVEMKHTVDRIPILTADTLKLIQRNSFAASRITNVK